jgi:hypothetical protein
VSEIGRRCHGRRPRVPAPCPPAAWPERVPWPAVDIELILDAAEAEMPGLRALARRFLEAEATRLGVPLDEASVLARHAEGVPEVYVTAAGDELVEYLAAQPDALGNDSALMVLARAGAQAMVTSAEVDGARPQLSPH